MNRFMFFWRIAKRLPIVIVAMITAYIIHSQQSEAGGEDHEECHGSRAFRHNRQITRDGCRGSLVDVGRPEMEGHERKLETNAGYHERDCRDKQTAHLAALYHPGQIVEIERPGGEGVHERETHHEDGGGENSRQDILDGSLMALIVTLLEGHHRGQGQRGRLQADDEEKEMTGRDHEIHSEESDEHQLEKLSLAYHHILAVDPSGRLKDDDERAYVENRLDGVGHGVVDIHTAEYRLAARRHNPDGNGAEEEQHSRHRRQEALLGVAGKEVGQQDYHEDAQHDQLRKHRHEL